MKITKLIFLIVLSFIIYNLSFITPVFAHLAGQPSFLKVNEKYAVYYNVPLTSLSDFDLPQDSAPENYLVNQNLQFELDLSRLPAPPAVVEKTKFTWEFGDGERGLGLKQSHTYTKMGTYILNVYADDGTTPSPQLLEKIAVNILPNKDYQLPKAVIKVNGQKSKDPLTDILQFKFGENLSFDASESESTSRIISYFWDFGDQSSGNGKTATHILVKDLTQVFPVLRIKNSDGFIADGFLQIKNSTVTGGGALSDLRKSSAQNSKTTAPSQLKYTLMGVAILASLVVAGVLYSRRKKLKKN